MKIAFLTLFAGAAAVQAAVLPPQQLLPQGTVLVVTAPDAPAAWNLWTNSTAAQLLCDQAFFLASPPLMDASASAVLKLLNPPMWRDPAFRPFHDKFMDRFNADAGPKIEGRFGLNLDDFLGLLRGQATFAVIAADPNAPPADRYASVLLVDAKDRAGDLKRDLADLKAKWKNEGKPVKTRQIRGIDFNVAELPPAPPDTNSDSGDTPPPPSKPRELIFGQVDSLLVMSDRQAAVEKILSRAQGGLAPPLEQDPVFEADYAARLRGAPLYAWVNTKAIFRAPAAAPPDAGAASPGLNPLLGPLGFLDIVSASLTWRVAPGGLCGQVFVNVPDTRRAGLLKAFTPEPMDAQPPPFVPARAVKFWRWRLNLSDAWRILETMINEYNPQGASLLNMLLQNAGKDKDEKYDLRTELLANFGDDVISYQEAPADNTLAALKSPPSILLIGSPKPENLAAAIKVALGVMGQTTGGVQERDFLGRKIYYFVFPGQASQLNFAASGGYVAFSTDSLMVEEYLRGGADHPLSATPGLAEAEQQIGGAGSGFFAYANESAIAKSAFDVLHGSSLSLSDLIGPPPLPGGTGVNPMARIAPLSDWADFSLLPDFGAVAKYYSFSVQSLRQTPEGFSLNVFIPTPPALRGSN